MATFAAKVRPTGIDNTTIQLDSQGRLVSAGTVLGGTTGQILAKKSNADLDVEWVDITDYFVME